MPLPVMSVNRRKSRHTLITLAAVGAEQFNPRVHFVKAVKASYNGAAPVDWLDTPDPQHPEKNKKLHGTAKFGWFHLFGDPRYDPQRPVYDEPISGTLVVSLASTDATQPPPPDTTLSVLFVDDPVGDSPTPGQPPGAC